MRASIQNWLANPNSDYKEGLALYNNTKRNSEFDKFFESIPEAKPKSLHHNMLRNQLTIHYRWLSDATEELLVAQPIAGIKRITSSQTPGRDNRLAIVQNKKLDIDSLPRELKIVHENIKAGYDKMRQTHANMKVAQTDEARADLRSDLITVEDSILKGWSMIDDYSRNPEQWNPKSDNDLRVIEAIKLIRRESNLVIYIPREMKKLEKATPEMKVELESKINKMTNELAFIREKIKSYEQ